MAISSTSGLTSSIDYQSLITQLVNVKSLPVRQLNNDKTAIDNKSTAYNTLNTKVNALSNAIYSMKFSAAFNVFSSSVSDSTMMNVSTTSASTTGSYQIIVNNLAHANKIAANGVALDTDPIAAGSGSFKFKLGTTGTEQTIAVDATTTLQSLKDSINNLGAGVTAAIVNDGSGAAPYRLILTSASTGLANSINITQNDTSTVYGTTLQAAQDASFSVDGLTFSRSSNSVSDVITGATLNLTNADPLKTTTVSVSRDVSGLQTKVSDIFTKYNDIVSYIKSNNRYDSATKLGGVFFGDSTARNVWDRLRNVMTATTSGLPSTMNRLGHIGMSVDKDGVMSLDSTKFSTAINSTFSDVVNLFTGTGSVTGFATQLYDASDSIGNFVDGTISNKLSSLSKNTKAIVDSIATQQRQISQYQIQVTNQFNSLETMLTSIKSQSSFLAGLYSSSTSSTTSSYSSGK